PETSPRASAAHRGAEGRREFVEIKRMGLDINAVQFLIAARKRGMEFGDVVMLGRQDLNVYPSKMKALLESHGFSGALFAPGAPDSGFAEPVFKSLGANNVYAL